MIAALRATRSALSLAGVCALFLACGLYQRVVLWPWILLRPRGRRARVGAYMRWVSLRVFQILRLGGARFERSGTIPTDRPVLVVMNHQSLLDIPTAILMCAPAAPRFVTRARYARFIPLVSPLLRISEAPIVDPTAARREAVLRLARTAETLESALLIFPEGQRSRDGSLGRFQSAGLRAILGARSMPVYLIVSDGFWVCRSLADFFFHVDRVRGRSELIGPLDPPKDARETGPFIAETRRLIDERLLQMRSGAAHG